MSDTPMTDAAVSWGPHEYWPDGPGWVRATLSRQLERDRAELIEALRCERMLRLRIASPWDCTEPGCYGYCKPMDRNCRCFLEKQKEHNTLTQALLARLEQK